MNTWSLNACYQEYHVASGWIGPQRIIGTNTIVSVNGDCVFPAEPCLLHHKTAKMQER